MENRDKLGKFLKGHKLGVGFKFSEESKKKMSIAHKGRVPWSAGKHLSQETKDRISSSLRKRFSGENNPAWKGGRKRHSHGYILIHKPIHPLATKDGYVMKHRLVMEEYLGRYLTSKEKVHHRNGIKIDNWIENLQIVGKPHYGEIECPFCKKSFLIQ